ncbi:hypothetical protein ASPSYDRAFT_33769 [Aspergillus sydowii CBS 593.65]|uniref:feruloyl esterase n=1 Tax=Aspergillus sydowii CBS 593.65 TaxID=1036612 RepID=A0A1L9TBA9_9EURO|nr:uncharacterized protein ASPSYDRAFT_33769 [Aspergillus sydowii CBS 593.65]OJJ56702.1 hypothetical protein ASPSYDRAFT_33769 [Aspergillus sydowii CBS 593.65]
MHRMIAFALLVGQCFAQTQVSPDLYKKFERYTAFSAASYADSCTTPPSGSSVVQYSNDNPTDTQATLFEDVEAKELIIAFRGTSTPKDLETDFKFSLVPLTAPGTDCSKCKVHSGFQEAYQTLADDVSAKIESELSAHSDYSLIVTGHSLGAGIAAIATAALTGLGHEMTTYTFGEPKNGDQEFADYLESLVSDDNYYRITHANDGVPQIPPALLDYVHHGAEYWQKQSGMNDATTTFACGKGSSDCNAAQDFGDNPINRAHLTYTSSVIGNSLNVVACGAEEF